MSKLFAGSSSGWRLRALSSTFSYFDLISFNSFHGCCNYFSSQTLLAFCYRIHGSAHEGCQILSRAHLLLKDRLVSRSCLLPTLSSPRAIQQASPTEEERKHHSRLYGFFWKTFSGEKKKKRQPVQKKNRSVPPQAWFWLQDVFSCCSHLACCSLVWSQISKAICCGNANSTEKTRAPQQTQG